MREKIEKKKEKKKKGGGGGGGGGGGREITWRREAAVDDLYRPEKMEMESLSAGQISEPSRGQRWGHCCSTR